MQETKQINASQQKQSLHPYNKILDRIEDGTRITENCSSKMCENCKLLKQEFDTQIFSLKDKAHQSFMQIIQVQQLHEQEMELMKAEHAEELSMLKQHIQLQDQNSKKLQSQLDIMEKNCQHQYCNKFQAQQPSFLIENIDIIECKAGSERQMSNLDQSSYAQFNDLIDENKNLRQPHLKKSLKTEAASSKCSISENEPKVVKLCENIKYLERQIGTLKKANEQLRLQNVTYSNNSKTLKNNYDQIYKQAKFLSDHIRTVSADKFKLEKKVKMLQKEIKQLKGQSITSAAMIETSDLDKCKSQKILTSSGLFSDWMLKSEPQFNQTVEQQRMCFGDQNIIGTDQSVHRCHFRKSSHVIQANQDDSITNLAMSQPISQSSDVAVQKKDKNDELFSVTQKNKQTFENFMKKKQIKAGLVVPTQHKQEKPLRKSFEQPLNLDSSSDEEIIKQIHSELKNAKKSMKKNISPFHHRFAKSALHRQCFKKQK